MWGKKFNCVFCHPVTERLRHSKVLNFHRWRLERRDELNPGCQLIMGWVNPGCQVWMERGLTFWSYCIYLSARLWILIRNSLHCTCIYLFARLLYSSFSDSLFMCWVLFNVIWYCGISLMCLFCFLKACGFNECCGNVKRNYKI